jgi:hypothetical protein
MLNLLNIRAQVANKMGLQKKKYRPVFRRCMVLN